MDLTWIVQKFLITPVKGSIKWYIRENDGSIREAVDIEEANRHLMDGDARKISNTEFEDGSSVSTVFLSMDHNHGLSGHPILFETLVFGGILDGEMRRYATEAEAREGHREMVELIRSKSEWNLEQT